MGDFIYIINGKEYVQKKLVLMQWNQLLKVIEGVSFTLDSSPTSMVYQLGERVPEALAIVLCETNISIREKNIESVKEDMELADIDIAVKVIEDFFGCNPIVSLLEKFQGLMVALTNKVKDVEKPSLTN